MATKRVPIKRDTKVKITPHILDVYARVKTLWEADQEESDEYTDACIKLHELLGLPPWSEAVEHCFNEDKPPKWMVSNLLRVIEWKKSHAIRAQLDAALQQRGR